MSNKEASKFYVIHPKSKENVMKEILIFLLSTLVILRVPLDIAFTISYSFLTEVLFLAIDVIFLIDIALNFRIGYIEKGVYESDPAKIKERYMDSGFKMDLLTSLPLTYASPLIFFIPRSFLKLIRLLRIFRLLRQFNFLQSAEIFNRNLIWFFQLFFNFFILTHCIACFWLGLGRYYGLESTEWLPAKEFDEIPYVTQYLRAFFWAFSAMTSNGLNPKSSIEVIFSLAIVFIGLTFYATLVGSVGSFIISSDLSTQLFREKMEKIEEFSKYRNLPTGLQKRIKSYYEYLYSRHTANNEHEIIEELPISLKQDVCMFMNKDIVEKVEFFKNCNKNLMSSIVTHLKPIVSIPGEYIIKEGDVGKEMFFILNGACEVVVETKEGSKTVAILKDGSFFGESSVLFQEKRNASVRALTYVDLYILTKEVLDEIQNEFPDFKEMMEKVALKRKREIKTSINSSRIKTNVALERDKILEDLKSTQVNEDGSDPIDMDSAKSLIKSSKDVILNSLNSSSLNTLNTGLSTITSTGLSSFTSIVSSVNSLATSSIEKIANTTKEIQGTNIISNLLTSSEDQPQKTNENTVTEEKPKEEEKK